MHRYDHGGDIFDIDIRLDFSVNLNPLGMPDEVKAAIRSHADEFAAYPDIYCRELCRAIAAKHGVTPGDVLCGNGAADLIYRIFLARKPNITLLLAPTFSEYERAAAFCKSEIRYHRLKEELGFALTDDILCDIRSDTDILFLCSPNNPTGQLIDFPLMQRIAMHCKETNTLLVVDECFLAFTDGISCKVFLDSCPNMAILDAFTKRYAMAGLRLGYMLSKNHRLIAAMRQAGPLWNVSAAAQAAGLAALKCTGYEERAAELIAAERPYMVNALNDMGLKTYPTSANYILFRSEKQLKEPLLKHGILIRACGNFEGLDDSFYRVCVMEHEQNAELITAIKEVLHG